MSSFNTVAERPLPFAQDAEPGVYLADPSRRLKAYLLDSIIIGIIFGIAVVATNPTIAAIVAGAIWSVLNIVLNTKKSGISPAKKKMNMRVVDAKTFQPLNLVQMILRRGLLGTIVGEAGLIASVVIPSLVLNAIGLSNGLLVVVATVAAVYAYASIPMRNSRNRNVWDIVSGTQVVFDKFDTLTTPIVETKLSLESDLLTIEGLNVSFATPRGNLKAVRCQHSVAERRKPWRRG